MSFTLTDKTLLDRAARLINDQARLLGTNHGTDGWSTDDVARKAKLVYDRLLRDERDLRALGQRMAKHFDVRPALRAPKQKPMTATEVTTTLADVLGPVLGRPVGDAGSPELPMVLQHDDDMAGPVCSRCLKRDVAMCDEPACPMVRQEVVAYG